MTQTSRQISRYASLTAFRDGRNDKDFGGACAQEFMKKKAKERAAEEYVDWCGLIEKGVRVEGALHLSGTFRFDGELKGAIFSTAKLILAENSVVEGDVHGTHVTIAGKITGKLYASKSAEILGTGRVAGEIHTPELQIQPGGIFDGLCYVPATYEGEKPLAIPVKSAFGEEPVVPQEA